MTFHSWIKSSDNDELQRRNKLGINFQFYQIKKCMKIEILYKWKHNWERFTLIMRPKLIWNIPKNIRKTPI